MFLATKATAVPPVEETLETLDSFVRAGKVRHLGWSNVRTWRLERIRRLCDRNGWTAPVAVQQQHSYLRPNGANPCESVVGAEQWDYLSGHDDLTLVAYSPILKGIYDNKAKRADRPAHARAVRERGSRARPQTVRRAA